MSGSASPPDLLGHLDGVGLNRRGMRDLHRYLVGVEQPIVPLISELIRRRDGTRLLVLRDGVTPLHEALDDFAPHEASIEEPLDAPFRADESTSACGLRALAALGLGVLNGEEDAPASVRSWFEAANGGLPGAAAVTVAATKRELAGSARRTLVRPRVGVLLDLGDEGQRLTLRTRLVRGLPPALIPDPRHMALFAADHRFQEALAEAWRQAGGERIQGAVLWSLSDQSRSPEWVEGSSFGAAFAVLVEEVRRRQRRTTGFMTLRRVRTSTAVVGALGPDGALRPVGGYRCKLSAAGQGATVIVPVADAETAKGLAGLVHDAEIVGARTWREAARAARRPDRMAVARLVLAAGLAVAVTAGLVTDHYRDERQRADLRETAGRVAAKARELGDGDPTGLGLLLAMASDDLAARAGRRSRVFTEVADASGSLVRQLRPPRGAFSGSAISRDGAHTLLSTDAGSLVLIDTSTGSVLWSRQYPPGFQHGWGQVYATALAFAPDGQHAAFAASDRSITLLRRAGGRWEVASALSMPVPARRGGLLQEANTAQLLSYGPDGRTLTAYGWRIGVLHYRLGEPGGEPRRCPVPARDVKTLEASSKAATLLRPHETVALDLDDCTLTRRFKPPNRVTLVAAGDDAVVGTRDTELVLLRQGREKVLSNDGPFSNVAVTSGKGETWVTAGSRATTFGWEVKAGEYRYSLRGSGIAKSTGPRTIWYSRSVAAVHDASGAVPYSRLHDYTDFFCRFVAWAGGDLVVGRPTYAYVLPGAAQDRATRPRLLPGPSGDLRMNQLVVAPSGRWGAGLFLRPARSRVVLWDIPAGRQVRIEPEINETVTALTFAGDRLFLGHPDGVLRVFRPAGDVWLEERRTRAPGGVFALDSGPRRGHMALVTAGSGTAPLTISEIAIGDLRVRASRALSGMAAPVQVTSLADGGYVVGHGPGRIEFLDAALRVRGHVDEGVLGSVRRISEIPGRGEVVVSGGMMSLTFDIASRTRIHRTWGRLGVVNSAAMSADGRLFAVGNFMRGRISVGHLRTEDRRRQACAAIGRDLTRAEWQKHVGSAAPYRKVCRA